MSKEKIQRNIEKIRFSIGAKLILIISFIIIVSFSIVIFFGFRQAHTDVRKNAEAVNMEINRISSLETESVFTRLKSSSKLLIQSVSSFGLQRAVIQDLNNFFFSENPQILAVFIKSRGGESQLLLNSQTLSLRGIDERAVELYFANQAGAFARAERGETLLRNASLQFSRPILALFFPCQTGAEAGILISSENINSNFSYGINKSFMINSDGDLLAYADFSFVREGSNVASLDFIRTILESRDNRGQKLFESDFGMFESASLQNNDIILNVWERLSPQIMPLVKSFSNVLAGAGIQNNLSAEKKARQYIAFTKLNAANVIVITSVDYNRVFDGVYSSLRYSICFAVIILLVSIILMAIISKSLSTPLKSLAAASRQIEEGNFNPQLKYNSPDEIGVLTSDFKKMSCALNNLAMFTNREIAVKAVRGEIKPGGMPKQCTVLFTDIHEFAAKSGNFSRYFGNDGSDKMINWLNHYYKDMIECVEKTNGVVDKLIGDALMAHWGTLLSGGSPRKDAFACIKAALMMRKTLYYMNRERKKGDPANPMIRFGCGINSGIVTAGQLGSEKHMEYTVIGEPVNLAAQIGSFANPLGADILISEDTWNLVGDKFRTEEVPSVTVKGREKPVMVFAVINFLREPKGPQNLEEVRTLLGIEMN